MKDDGKYYAENGVVWKAPLLTKTDDGDRISMGFPVCTMHEVVGSDAAEAVAELLNLGTQAQEETS